MTSLRDHIKACGWNPAVVDLFRGEAVTDDDILDACLGDTDDLDALATSIALYALAPDGNKEDLYRASTMAHRIKNLAS